MVAKGAMLFAMKGSNDENSQKFDAKRLTCPHTGRIMTEEQITMQTDADGGVSIWWRCSACRRWHMERKEFHKSR